MYFCLHAEQTITSAIIDYESNSLHNTLTIDTLRRVKDNILENSNVVLDFIRIDDSQQNIHIILADINKKTKSLTLLNVNDCNHKKLELGIITNSKNVADSLGFYQIFYVSYERDIDAVFYAKDLFNLTFKEVLKQNIIKQQIPHISSSVYLSSYIDLKRFISRNNAFMLLSIYHLAIKIKKKWIDDNSYEPILVCQNSNSAYIASILSSFLKLNILILDKIGPINQVYTRLGNPIQDGKNYVIVSDLICLGTEVKIAKNIIEFLGGKYLGNVSIIRTRTLAKKDRSFENALTVFTISKSNNKDLGYYIYSDLEKYTDE